jgi:hypothetical protein
MWYSRAKGIDYHVCIIFRLELHTTYDRAIRIRYAGKTAPPETRP